MKKKIKKSAIYWLSLFIAWPFYYFLLGCEKLGLKFLVFKISQAVVKQFGQEAIEQRVEYDPLKKKPVVKVILALPSFGCCHYFQRGGCAMCGFNREIEKYHFRWLHPWALVLLVKLFISNLAAYLSGQPAKSRPPVFCLAVFMAGSFFCFKELPQAAQKIVIDYFLASGFQKLLLESRPEYIVKEKKYIQRLAKSIKNKGKELEVAIGLESADETVRNKYIRKNLRRQTYGQAIKILKSQEIIVNTYILIGAPFASELEIISLAVLSAQFAWQLGSDIVSFEAYCVQAGTKWADLYRQGKLILPSLWAILEIIRQVNKISANWFLGEFSDWPQPIARPDSCPRCAKYLLAVLGKLRSGRNLKDILAGNFYYCACNKVFKISA